MMMNSTIVVGLMTLLSVLAVFAGRTNAQRFRGGIHGEELRTVRRMEIITPPSDALPDVDAHALDDYDDEDEDEDHDELALRGGHRALTDKSKSKKSKSKSKKSKSKTDKSMKSKSDKGTKSTKKSKSDKSDKGTKSTKKSKSDKSDKGTKSTKKSKSKSKSSKSKSMKSMTGTQRAAVLDRLQILNGGGASTSLADTNPQLQAASSGLAGRGTGLGLMNLLDHNDEMDVFGQKLPRANINNDNAAAAETTTLSKLAQLAAVAF